MTPWTKVQTNYLDKRNEEDGTEYMEVPGGRLYRHWIAHRSGCSVSLAFVPTSEREERLKEEIRRLNGQIAELLAGHDRDGQYHGPAGNNARHPLDMD